MHLFTQVDDENDFLEIYLNGNLVAQKDLPENPFPTIARVRLHGASA